MLPSFLLLDLETTGGNPVQDRITEIAAVRIEEGREVARWSSLVNPGCRIPGFIQNLTGISNAMVAEAPAFSEVAGRLMELLDGAVLVAHNVRFDHGFLVQEYQRLGISLSNRTLCTVRLSRLLYPQHRSHGLDAIMQRHGLTTLERHRAMGDVDLVLAWLAQVRQEFGEDLLQQRAQQLLQGSAAIPPHLETDVARIPDTPGVYLFFGEGPIPLYVGKSVHLRSRVMSHFQAAAREAREMRMAQEIRRIEWRETAGELGALLLESRLVKQLQPLHNRQLRRERRLFAWQLADDPQRRPQLQLVDDSDFGQGDTRHLFGVFRSRRQALETLRALGETHALCPQLLGLESGRGRCFAHQLGRCRGACCGQESVAQHQLRVQTALAEHRLKSWPYPGAIGLREHSADGDRTEIHLFNQWRHMATVRDEESWREALQDSQPLAFDLDTYRLLLRTLAQPRRAGLTLVQWPDEAGRSEA